MGARLPSPSGRRWRAIARRMGVCAEGALFPLHFLRRPLETDIRMIFTPSAAPYGASPHRAALARGHLLPEGEGSREPPKMRQRHSASRGRTCGPSSPALATQGGGGPREAWRRGQPSPQQLTDYRLSRRVHVTLPVRESPSRGLKRGLAAITESRNQPDPGKTCAKRASTHCIGGCASPAPWAARRRPSGAARPLDSRLPLL
jgi:hypothetical protein